MKKRPGYDNSGQAFAADIEAILAKGNEITIEGEVEPTNKKRRSKKCSGSDS